jgi:hypothetical protein
MGSAALMDGSTQPMLPYTSQVSHFEWKPQCQIEMAHPR